MSKKPIVVVPLLGLFMLASSASAALLYGFEDGISELTFTGTANRHKSGDVSGINATEGNKLAYLTNGPDPSDGDGTMKDGDDLATMSYTFSGDTNSVLSFDFNVLTSEISSEDADYFQFILDGSILFTGVIGEVNYAAADFTYTGGDPEGLRAPDGSRFVDGQTGWRSYSTSLSFTGSHTLSFLVDDGTYKNKDTALLIDNIKLASSAPVPEPATMLLFGTGIAGLVAVRRKKKA